MQQNKQRINLKKIDISKNIYKQIGLPVNYSEKILDDFIQIIIETLISKKEINIKNFGKFILKNKMKRVGRNPKNNKIYQINKRNVVIFKTSKIFKKKINFSHEKR
tara:strand:+ start:259 stop:576 length:318 start_codon:yes stop_codon:yes gene_type:complete